MHLDGIPQDLKRIIAFNYKFVKSLGITTAEP